MSTKILGSGRIQPTNLELQAKAFTQKKVFAIGGHLAWSWLFPEGGVDLSQQITTSFHNGVDTTSVPFFTQFGNAFAAAIGASAQEALDHVREQKLPVTILTERGDSEVIESLRIINALASTNIYTKATTEQYLTAAQSLYRKIYALSPECHSGNADLLSLILLRAGLYSDNLFFNLPIEAPPQQNAVAMEVKRFQTQGADPAELNALVVPPSPEELQKLHGKDIVIADTALATGSSVLATLVMLHMMGITPRSVHFKALVCAPAAIPMIDAVMKLLGIEYTITAATIAELDPHYYLIGNGTGKVGDAGKWYANILYHHHLKVYQARYGDVQPEV